MERRERRIFPGRTGQAALFDGRRYVEVGKIANFGFYDAFTLSAWIYPTSATGAIISRAQDLAEGQGFGLYLKDGRLNANLVRDGSMTAHGSIPRNPYRSNSGRM